jgi:ABC-type dipeptide/oligopeptide/nickel transport system permease subunit
VSIPTYTRLVRGQVLALKQSFLGLGAQAPAPEWGALVATGKTYLRSAPHW